jgi:hypothetical protein
MVAKLAGAAGAAGSVVSALSSFTGSANAKGGGVPFTITGTTSHPVFVPDVANALKNVVKSGAGTSGSAASQAAGILGGFLNKKK